MKFFTVEKKPISNEAVLKTFRVWFFNRRFEWEERRNYPENTNEIIEKSLARSFNYNVLKLSNIRNFSMLRRVSNQFCSEIVLFDFYVRCKYIFYRCSRWIWTKYKTVRKCIFLLLIKKLMVINKPKSTWKFLSES